MVGINDMKLDNIKGKVVKLTALITVLSDENLVLKKENTELKQKLGDLRAKYDSEQVADVVENALSEKKAKKLLRDMLREIDECKRIING